MNKIEQLEMQNTVVICDEFDSILFGNDNDVMNATKIFPKLNKLIGFTGSDLREFHVKAAERAIDGTLIKMNVDDVFKPPPLCHAVEVFSKISDFRDIVETLCIQQVPKTPMIIIADDEKNLLARKLQRAGLTVEVLWSKSFAE